MTLTWTDPVDESITGYQVLRRVRGPGPGFEAIVDDTGSAAATYVDASVTPDTRYTYRVKARNSAGLSEQSSYANVDVPAAPETVPAQPQGLTVDNVSDSSVTLSWDDPDDDSITGYQVLRRVRADGTDFAVIEDDTGKADTEFTDATVEPDTDYAYRVKARNSAGLSPASGDANADVPAAPAQQNQQLNLFAGQLQAIDADGTLISQTVELSWEDPDDDAITGYQILRKVADSGTDFAVIKADTGTTGLWYSDATVEPGDALRLPGAGHRLRRLQFALQRRRSGNRRAAAPAGTHAHAGTACHPAADRQNQHQQRALLPRLGQGVQHPASRRQHSPHRHLGRLPHHVHDG